MPYRKKNVGVLALQGDYERHSDQVRQVGAQLTEIRLPAQLAEIDALVMPGGESTTMDILIDRFGLREPLKVFSRSKPIYGTCAGMILLATMIEDNLAGVRPLQLMDIDVVRNGYGRQVYSFDEELTARLDGEERTFRASFIRAPKVTRLGSGVEVLSEFEGVPVLVKQGNLLAASFHTELTRDTTLLEYFLTHFVLDSPAG